LQVDERRLARDLGVPVVPASARYRQGLEPLLSAISDVATGRTVCRPYRIQNEPPELKRAIDALVEQINLAFPGLPNARWVALRLLDGDERIVAAIRAGELGDLKRGMQEESHASIDLALEAAR
jgi:ferrous iron transport protein B